VAREDTIQCRRVACSARKIDVQCPVTAAALLYDAGTVVVKHPHLGAGEADGLVRADPSGAAAAEIDADNKIVGIISATHLWRRWIPDGVMQWSVSRPVGAIKRRKLALNACRRPFCESNGSKGFRQLSRRTQIAQRAANRRC
jgi:hypothetical protein